MGLNSFWPYLTLFLSSWGSTDFCIKSSKQTLLVDFIMPICLSSYHLTESDCGDIFLQHTLHPGFPCRVLVHSLALWPSLFTTLHNFYFARSSRLKTKEHAYHIKMLTSPYENPSNFQSTLHMLKSLYLLILLIFSLTLI